MVLNPWVPLDRDGLPPRTYPAWRKQEIERRGITPAPPRRPRVTWLDPDASHQIRLMYVGSAIGVSCTCQAHWSPHHKIVTGYQPIEARGRWDPGEALARWRQHVNEINDQEGDRDGIQL